jgi:hypothetical protein
MSSSLFSFLHSRWLVSWPYCVWRLHIRARLVKP